MRSRSQIFLYFTILIILSFFYALNSEAAVNGVSGAAYLYPETSTYRAKISIDISQYGGEAPSGGLQYYYTRTRMNFASTGITSLSIDENEASISGTGSVNGVGGYTFTATVVDGSPDIFGIVILKPGGSVYYSAGPIAIAGGDLTVRGDHPPSANAGPDQTVRVTQTISLDGSKSSDVDGDPLTYRWSFASVPTGSAAVLTKPSAVKPAFTADKPGTYVIQLIVNDGTVDSAPDTVLITTENSIPVADAGPDQTVRVSQTVSLDGSKSSDVDGNLLTYHWTFAAVPPGSAAVLTDAFAVKPAFTADKPGTYVIQLIVNDGTMDSAPDTVLITTENSVPVADAGPDQTVRVTQTVSLDGSKSSDVDGDPLTYYWSFTSVPPGSAAVLTNPSAMKPAFAADRPGTYVIQLIVNDGIGDSIPDTVTISTENSKPVANAGNDQAVYAGDTVKLNGGISSDVDKDPLTYRWSFTSVPYGSSATLSDSTKIEPLFVADREGIFVVQLIVNDGKVDSEPDTVTITVSSYMVTVPNVVAMSQAAAESAVISATLTVGTVTSDYSNAIPKGDVIGQYPLAGSLVAQGTPINLVISLGPSGPTNNPPTAIDQSISIIRSLPFLPPVWKPKTAAITLQGLDPDGDTLNYELIDMPMHGELKGTPPSLTYIPNSSCYAGADRLTFRVSDGRLSSELATVDIYVSDDCNRNGVADLLDVKNGVSKDCNGNGIPDDCDVATKGRGFNDLASWSAFDPGANGIGNCPYGYAGGAYDGRYVYFAPTFACGLYSGEILRYDTQAEFSIPGAWKTHNMGSSQTATGTTAFSGAVFDGRYVYFIPGGSGPVVRYDTTADFQSGSSYSVFSPREAGVAKIGVGFVRGLFDGRYLYLVPHVKQDGSMARHGEVVRYDTSAAFQDPQSWQAFDPGDHGIGKDPDGFGGAVFDGRHIYFVPLDATGDGTGYNGEVIRYDTQADFMQPGSWSAYDSAVHGTVTEQHGYFEAVYDGRYVYFGPYALSGIVPYSQVLRYDTQLGFQNSLAWSTFNAGEQGLVQNPCGYRGVVYDCRNVYFVPYLRNYNARLFNSEVLRYDATMNFQSVDSWSAYNPITAGLSGIAPGYDGAIFDGRYIYFAPSHDNPSNHHVLRYDTWVGTDDIQENGIPDSCEQISITIPNVVGMTQAAAELTLKTAGLTVGVVTTEHNDTVPAGSVVSQNPAAGASVPKNTPVNIVLSTGSTTGNQPPTITSSAILNTTFSQAYSYQVIAGDPNTGDTLTYSLPSAPAGMTIDATTGLISWTSSLMQIGSYPVTIRVTDPWGLFVEQTYTLSVTNNTIPVADAGTDQTVYANETVTLDGSKSSDADGDPLTYQWSIDTRPTGSAATLSNPTAVNPTFVADKPGSYELQLIVNDGKVDSLPDAVTISTENSKPVANAGTDQTVYVNQTVTLDGSKSSDGDGDPLTYKWSFVTRPTGSAATLSNPVAVKPTFVADKPGSYELQLIVNDGKVDSLLDAVTISTENSKPVADAGADQTVLVNQTVTLDGSKSSDVDGDPLTYKWSFVTRPTGSTATLSNPATVNPTFIADKPGAYVLQLIVKDGKVDSVPDTVTINTENSKPVAKAGTDQTGYAGDAVNLDGKGSADVDGDSLTYRWSFTSRPSGSSAALSNPGIVNPNFTADLEGIYVIQLIVNDGKVDSEPDTVTITVSVKMVTVPNIVGIAQSSAQSAILAAELKTGSVSTSYSNTVPAGAVISQNPAAGTSVPKGSAVSFAVSLGLPLVNVPNLVSTTQAAAAATLSAAVLTMGTVTTESNETFPAGTVIRQNPAAGTMVAAGSAVNIVVSSGAAAPQLASILVTPASPTITTSGSQQFTAIGILDNGSSQVLTAGAVWGSSNPAVAFVSSTPGLIGSATMAGTVTISASYGGKTGSAVMTVVQQTTNTTPPTAEITSPVDQAIIVTPVPVIGKADDPEFLKYIVEMAPVGEISYTAIAESTKPVTNGTLGTLDPTLLVNGLYKLRLRVIDRGGIMVTTAPIQVQIKRELKVGNFTLAFSDSNIPYACLPVTVTRVYDSRDKKVGDFGVGWRLDLQTLQLHETGTMGTGWAIDLVNKPGPFGIPILTYVLYGTAPHMVSLTLHDGQVEEFDLKPSPSESKLTPIDALNLVFTPRPGTLGTLAPVLGSAIYKPRPETGSTQLIDESNVTVFDPQQYRYTSKDGSVYLIDKTAGVQKVQCSNGMAITVTPGGIRHDSGGGVNFTRDNLGRITSLTDPNGRTQTYTYDANGDLASHTDGGGNDTKFLYNYSHGLIEIRDPRGVAAIRNEYDNDGRLISSTDPLGRKSTFDHDLVARRETVTDRLGQVTVHEYDASGNIIRTTDPLGGITTRTYDAYGNELTRTDPLGRTTSFDYDSRRNVTKETDALGNTTTYAYNALNQVTRVADPLGRGTTNTYDTSGNLTQSQDALGKTTTYAYDSGGIILPGSGNLLSKTDALGNVTAYGYDRYGRMTKETDALGRVTSYTYDANGNRLTQTTTRVVNGATETLTTRYEYDANNRLTKTTHPDGLVTRTEYNAIGKQARTIDALGRVTSYEYDALGRLVRTAYPDGTSDVSTYDAEGRRIAGADRAGRTTTYAYDALGRVTGTTFADGTATGTTYDAAGQVVAGTDGNGNTTSYGYDAAGRRSSVVDATGAMTSFAYDAAGNQTEVTDANGNTVAFSYDANNRRTQTTYADGTFDTVTYDDLGRQVSKTDQAGKTTQFVYDALGRLLQVTDALGQVTRYGYDERGYQISQTDALGRVTRFTYDKMGRRTSRILPLGMRETMIYDNAGNLVSKTDFNGRTTTYAYDSVHRLLSKTPDPSFGQPMVHFTYTATGQRETMQDASGTTNYTYDNRDRLVTKATPQGTLYYTYDAAGNLSSITSGNAGGAQMSYTYDARNRLASVTDRHGITTYSYDPVGILAGFLYPNGVQTTYTYNTLNRLTNVTGTRGGTLAGYTYTLGPAGNRTSVSEASGRNVNYTYDALYRLTGETVNGDPSGKNGAVGYTYDAVGNRLVRTSTLPGIPSQAFAYDANDRITGESYDNNGNTLVSSSRSYSWDFENKLTSVDFGNVLFVYDGDGNRVARTSGGVTTQFLVDDRNPTGYAQVLEEISGGTVKKTYTYGLKLINQQQASGVSYYGFDGHGSVRYLTNAAGTVTDTYDYDAFGNLVRQTGTTVNVYLYAGEQNEANIECTYLRARFLSAGSGRFLASDPYKGHGFEPRSLHRYSYASNDPVNSTDPSGLFTRSDGYAVEYYVQEAYRYSHQSDLPYLNFGGYFVWDNIRVDLKPDIMNLNPRRKTFLEIKPLSLGGIYLGAAKIALDEAVLGEFGFRPEVEWVVNPPIAPINNKAMIIFNVGGVVFYARQGEITQEEAVEYARRPIGDLRQIVRRRSAEQLAVSDPVNDLSPMNRLLSDFPKHVTINELQYKLLIGMVATAGLMQLAVGF